LESGFVNDLGFSVQLDSKVRKDAFLFSESGSRVVVSVRPDKAEQLEADLAELGLPFFILGKVNTAEVNVDDKDYGFIEHWKQRYMTAIENYMK
jgi:phosphoribosylformylglycinamidine synthase